eukprot:scaffold18.g1973.t1
MADALVDAHDSLRTIALQARDVGSLSLALVAAHSDFSELWLALGRLARPRRQQSATSVSGAVDAVRRAAKKNSDTLRRKLICLTTAKKHFRLSDRELSSLRYHAAKKKHYARAPPMRLYSELESRQQVPQPQHTLPQQRPAQQQRQQQRQQQPGTCMSPGCGNTAAMNCIRHACGACCTDTSCPRHGEHRQQVPYPQPQQAQRTLLQSLPTLLQPQQPLAEHKPQIQQGPTGQDEAPSQQEATGSQQGGAQDAGQQKQQQLKQEAADEKEPQCQQLDD